MSGALDLAWLAKFDRRIPCPKCRRHWREIVLAYPPELGSRYLAFRWTVRAHNEINRLLGKPILTFAAAQERYLREGI